MSAERLREAAALMRERAEAATEVWGTPRWRPVYAKKPYSDGIRTSELDRHFVGTADEHGSILLSSSWDETQIVDHAASWHPAVALAVADWLEATAAENDSPDNSALGFLNFAGLDAIAAVAVANAYLDGGAS